MNQTGRDELLAELVSLVRRSCVDDALRESPVLRRLADVEHLEDLSATRAMRQQLEAAASEIAGRPGVIEYRVTETARRFRPLSPAKVGAAIRIALRLNSSYRGNVTDVYEAVAETLLLGKGHCAKTGKRALESAVLPAMASALLGLPPIASHHAPNQPSLANGTAAAGTTVPPDLTASTMEAADIVGTGPGQARATDKIAPSAPASSAVFHAPPRNPIFTGREQLLTDLGAALASGTHIALVQAITGLGGAGKTQVAIEYAHRHRHHYRVIWWLRAETPETLLEDLAALATPLGLTVPTDAPPAEVAATVRRELENTPGWLLVFDNADSLDVIRDHLPDRGHVLITSRNPAWRARATVLDVDVWLSQEAVAFLLTRTGRSDAGGAAALAEALGHLPLAVEQAGAYMEVNATPFARYLHLYRRGAAKLLAQHGPHDYGETVATTWRLSFDQVKDASPAAAELLELCAFLAPEAIPEDLFQPADRGLLPSALKDADDSDVEVAIGVLRRYSLIQRNDGTIGLHRLVQEVIRDALAPEVTLERVTAGVLLVRAAFPASSGDVRTWERCAHLLPHALAVASHAEGLAAEPEATSWLLDRMATYLQGRAELIPARRLFERAFAMAEAAYGPDHPEVAIRVNNLAGVLRDLGDLAGARRGFERALAIDEAAYGPGHPKVTTDVNNLALVLQDLGDLAEARQSFERALAIDEAAYGPDHPEVATVVNNLARVLRALGDLAEARQGFERALAIDEAAYGPDHPTVATDVNNLASVLRDLGDLAGARRGFERALAINEAAYGPDHPTVATVGSNLAGVLHDLGDLVEARQGFERALAIDEAAYGPHHPVVAIRVNNLARVLHNLGDLVEARRGFERALAIDEAAYGPDHPEVATNVANLANVLRDLGDLAGARQGFERALRIITTAWDPDHPRAVTIAQYLQSLD
jgi:tetratricopeptide (TPR) repeat protein